MKWDKYTIETTTEAEDYISCTLADLGIEGIEIEDNVPLSESDTSKMFIDIYRSFRRIRALVMSAFIWNPERITARS